jgi:hypothetical protein
MKKNIVVQNIFSPLKYFNEVLKKTFNFIAYFCVFKIPYLPDICKYRFLALKTSLKFLVLVVKVWNYKLIVQRWNGHLYICVFLDIQRFFLNVGIYVSVKINFTKCKQYVCACMYISLHLYLFICLMTKTLYERYILRWVLWIYDRMCLHKPIFIACYITKLFIYLIYMHKYMHIFTYICIYALFITQRAMMKKTTQD